MNRLDSTADTANCRTDTVLFFISQFSNKNPGSIVRGFVYKLADESQNSSLYALTIWSIASLSSSNVTPSVPLRGL